MRPQYSLLVAKIQLHNSAKATANLKELQIAELLKPNPAFPFDRPAGSLTEKRRRR